MAEYVNKEEVLKHCEALPKLYREAMRLFIKEIPSVNIVRCGECEYWERLNCEAPKEGWCDDPMPYSDEEAKVFLDNLKICINEHPVVADWLVEIADRKTEPQTCKNQKCKNYDTINDHCMFIEQCHYEPKDEPQTERPWGMYIVEHPMYE